MCNHLSTFVLENCGSNMLQLWIAKAFGTGECLAASQTPNSENRSIWAYLGTEKPNGTRVVCAYGREGGAHSSR
jgi:hypothetical protein